MTAKRVLITGATGFVGRHLVPHLQGEDCLLTLAVRNAAGVPPAWAAHPGTRIVEIGDVETASGLDLDRAFHDVQAVVHLAGRTEAVAAVDGDAETLFHGANVVATRRLVEAAIRHRVGLFLLASSTLAVTDNAARQVIDDAIEPAPTSLYGRSKHNAEGCLAPLSEAGIAAIALRLPLVVGPDAKGNWPTLVKIAATGVPLPFASIRNRRSLIGVDSVARLIAHLLARTWPTGVSGAYCVADAGPLSTAEIVAAIREGLSMPPRLVPVPPALLTLAAAALNQRRRISSLVGDCEVDDRRFRETFGFVAVSSARDSIRRAVAAREPAEDRRGETGCGARGPRGRPTAKRVFDLVLAAAAAPVVLPAVGLCAVAIKLTSPGPAIFRQARVGLNEAPFICYKLRTMHAGTPDAPSHETSGSAVTRIGQVLRTLKLDELPQIWNILKGDMSFVGPRPCLPSQGELIAERRARGLYTIRPGVTGVSQIAGVDMSNPEKLAALDATYLDRMSLMTDLKLIVATGLGRGRGDRVGA